MISQHPILHRPATLHSNTAISATPARPGASTVRPAAKPGEIDRMEYAASAPPSSPSSLPTTPPTPAAPERAAKRSLSGLFEDFLALPPDEQQAIKQMYPPSPVDAVLNEQAAPKRRRAPTRAEALARKRERNRVNQRSYRERARASKAASQQERAELHQAIEQSKASITELKAVGAVLTEAALIVGVSPAIIDSINEPLRRLAAGGSPDSLDSTSLELTSQID